MKMNILSAGDYGFNWDDVSHWRIWSNIRISVYGKSGFEEIILHGDDARAFARSILEIEVKR